MTDTRYELEAEIKLHKAASREASIKLAKINASDREEANKQLSDIAHTVENLMEEACNIANQHQLEFSIDWSQGSWDFESYDHGNWNTSTC